MMDADVGVSSNNGRAPIMEISSGRYPAEQKKKVDTHDELLNGLEEWEEEQ